MFLKDFKQKVKDLKKENTIASIGNEDGTDYGYLLDGILTWLTKNSEVSISNLKNDGTNVSVVLSGTNRDSLKDYLVSSYPKYGAKWNSNTNTFTMTLKPTSNQTKSEVTTNTTTRDPALAGVPNIYDLTARAITSNITEQALLESIKRIKQLF